MWDGCTSVSGTIVVIAVKEYRRAGTTSSNSETGEIDSSFASPPDVDDAARVRGFDVTSPRARAKEG